MTRLVAFTLAALLAIPAAAQVGKSLGVVDANTISEADLTKMAGITPAIAKALVLSEDTVRNHLSSAIGKTGAATWAEAARIAQENGWL